MLRDGGPVGIGQDAFAAMDFEADEGEGDSQPELVGSGSQMRTLQSANWDRGA